MAQSASLEMGARALGMGNASACLSGVWGLSNNIAGIADVKHPTVGFSYHAIPSFAPFNRTAASVAIPFRKGAAGLNLFRFGDDLYSEQVASAGVANTFGLASLGLQVNYLQYRAIGMENRTALTVSFGGIARLTPSLLFGAHILNINQPIINSRFEERVPTRLSTAVAFKPSEKVFISAEVEKELEYKPTLKAGLEYLIFRKLAFRTGFNLHPEAGFFGTGFKLRKLEIDYALQFGSASGASHQASVLYKFLRR